MIDLDKLTPSYLALKGVEGLWKVEEIFSTELEKNAIRTDWKVGGIKEVAR